MPLLKRVLLFAAELGILLVGIVVAFALAIHFDSAESQFPVIALFGTLLVSVVFFVLFRRKSQKWKIAIDAANFLKERSFRRSHPRRASLTRLLRRTLIRLPSLIAALTVRSLPAMSHMIFSGHHLVPHYRFSVPWNWTIVKAGEPYLSSGFSSVTKALLAAGLPLSGSINRFLPVQRFRSATQPLTTSGTDRERRLLTVAELTLPRPILRLASSN